MTEISINLDAPLILALLGLIIFYLGKCVSDSKVEKFDREGYYIEGLFFFAIFVFIPFVIADYVKDFELVQFAFQSLPLFITPFVLQIIILCLLLWNFNANKIRRPGLAAYYRTKLKEGMEKLKRQKTDQARTIKIGDENFKKMAGMDYSDLNFKFNYVWPIKYMGDKYVLFLLSFLTILFELQFYQIGGLPFYASVILTLFILSLLAFSFGSSVTDYPTVKIILDNGESIRGRVMKYGEFVELMQDFKRQSINLQKIVRIERIIPKK